MNTSVTTPNAELAKSFLPETSGRRIEIYLDHNEGRRRFCHVRQRL
ncbi:MAG: hypothetical protein U5L01_16855 [Rheinheimera sp.]|nr:hypothetical protein [Rheinheimera sp.]